MTCLLDKLATDAAFDVFAYRKDDETLTGDERRQRIPHWNIEKAVRWALERGFDTILIERNPHPATETPGVIHHLCRDPGCPGGCE